MGEPFQEAYADEIIELLADGFGAEDIAHILASQGWSGDANDVREQVASLREAGLLEVIYRGEA